MLSRPDNGQKEMWSDVIKELKNVDFRGKRPGSELICWITDITVYFLVFLGGLKSSNEG